MNSKVKYDWAAEISQNSYTKSIISYIKEIEAKESNIRNLKSVLKRETNNIKKRELNREIQTLNNKIRELENKIKTKNEEIKIKIKIPHFADRIKALSSQYFENSEDKYLKDCLRDFYFKEIENKDYDKEIKTTIHDHSLHNLYGLITTQEPKISILPLLSFYVRFKFSLALPCISKDDEEFYICENPIKKDKVFKIPMISGSSWKGNLRWTAMRVFVDKLSKEKVELNEKFIERAKLVRLFGYEKDSVEDYLNIILTQKLIEKECNKNSNETANEEIMENNKTKYVAEEFKNLLLEKGYIKPNTDGRRGRLNFFPTFFDDIGLEVINPHDRKTKAGKLPIYIESVPEGAKGTFSLLYVPFDLLGKPESEVKSEVAEDLDCVFEALKEMMLTYGFSAKKSSGFGVIKDEFEESLFDINGIDIEEKDKQFKNFLELEEKVKSVKQKLLKEESKK